MDEVAEQLLRALRGSRSQVAFSRRLGYRSNVAAKWESGRRFPTIGEVLRACERSGIDATAALARFHPPAAVELDPAAPDAMGRWLRALAGSASAADLARRSGLSRHQVGRLLRGEAHGHLPEWLAVVEAATGRVVDLVAELVDLDRVPALHEVIARRRATERWVVRHPWGPAVLAVLETRPGGWRVADAVRAVADGLGLDEVAARSELDAAVAAGAIDAGRGTLAARPSVSLSVAPSPDELAAMRAHWASVSAARAGEPAPDDVLSFNVFAVSDADLARIRDLQRAFFREVRSVVASSGPSETAAVLVVHTFALRTGGRTGTEGGPAVSGAG
ncbi:MAG: helix-turn-helix transcriptional regulator [Myxococcota bacterium]